MLARVVYFYRLKHFQIITLFSRPSTNYGILTCTGQRQSKGFPDFQSAIGDSIHGCGASQLPATVNLEERRLATSTQHDR